MKSISTAHRILPPTSRFYLDDIELIARDSLVQLQEQRLLHTVNFALNKSALVGKLWREKDVDPSTIKSIADFVELAPTLTKDDVRDFREAHGDPFGGLLCVPPEKLSLIGSSSGTTGDPTLFAWQWGSNNGSESPSQSLYHDCPSAYWGCTPRDLWAMGLRPGDLAVVATLRIRGPVWRVFQSIGLIPVPIGFAQDDIEQFVRISLELRPALAFILSNPQVMQLMELEKSCGVDMIDVFSSYKAVIFAGEPIGPRIRRVFEQWGVGQKLYVQTTLGDVAHAHDCPAHDGVHAWEDMAFIELFDADGNPIPGGEGHGELVVTSLANSVDPLIRYRSGDLVELIRNPCPCGRTHARFKPLGRVGDEVVVSGQQVLPIHIWSAIESVEATSDGLFQIIRTQREMPVLKLRVGYSGSVDEPTLIEALKAAVRRSISLDPYIELVPKAVLLKQGPPHKIPRTTKN